jgi:hypothetical protein
MVVGGGGAKVGGGKDKDKDKDKNKGKDKDKDRGSGVDVEGGVLGHVVRAWAEEVLGVTTPVTAHILAPIHQKRGEQGEGKSEGAAPVLVVKGVHDNDNASANKKKKSNDGGDNDGDDDDDAACNNRNNDSHDNLVLFSMERSLDQGNITALRDCAAQLPGASLLIGKIKIRPTLSKSARCVTVVSYAFHKGGFKGCRVLHLASDKQHERTILCSLANY